MGTIITRTKERPADHVRAMLRQWRGSTVLRLEEHDGQFYVAARIDTLTDDARRLGFKAGDVTAVVILAHNTGGDMHERTIGEDEGPFYNAASRSLLSLLSPLPPGSRFDNARTWRQRCEYERDRPESFQAARKIPHPETRCPARIEHQTDPDGIALHLPGAPSIGAND